MAAEVVAEKDDFAVTSTDGDQLVESVPCAARYPKGTNGDLQKFVASHDVSRSSEGESHFLVTHAWILQDVLSPAIVYSLVHDASFAIGFGCELCGCKVYLNTTI